MIFLDARPISIETRQSTDELTQLVHGVIKAHGIEPNMSWDEMAHELIEVPGMDSLRNYLGLAIARWDVLINREDEAHYAHKH